MLHLKWSLMLLISGVGSESALSHSSENWGVHALRRVWAISSGSVALSISATALARKRGECRCVVLWLASVLRLSPGSRSWSWSWVLGGWCFSRAIPSPYLHLLEGMFFCLFFPSPF